MTAAPGAALRPAEQHAAPCLIAHGCAGWAGWGSLTNLSIISCTGVYGSLPAEWASMPSLSSLSLFNNSISGTPCCVAVCCYMFNLMPATVMHAPAQANCLPVLAP